VIKYVYILIIQSELTFFKMASPIIAPSKRTVKKISLVEVVKSIEVDGTYGNDRYLVKINDINVFLTGKSFAYFAKLAWYRVHGKEGGWVNNEDIELGYNQARYLYRMKGEIREGLRKGEGSGTGNLGDSWEITENKRSLAYRLVARPGVITFNTENLKSHSDFTLRSLLTLQP
jgi:hypothetical protein